MLKNLALKIGKTLGLSLLFTGCMYAMFVVMYLTLYFSEIYKPDWFILVKWPHFLYQEIFHREPSLLLNMLFAGFEDMVFVAPVLAIYKLLGVIPKIKDYQYVVTVPLLCIFSMLFMAGHVYQGAAGVLIKVGYVPAAFFFAKRFGISKTIIGHSFFDILVTFLLPH